MKLIALILTIFMLSVCLHAQNAVNRMDFNQDWKFYLGEEKDAANEQFDDGHWRTLNLPHDWSIELPFEENSPTGTGGGALRGGLGWYRKTFTTPPDANFKKVFIDFDGVYMNSEFFGLFVMPLIGADWRIDDRNYIFGLLPGRLSYEHKWNEKLYGGATFRALTNSYLLQNGQYLRIDDNPVSLFMDYYPAKRFCVTLEPGYGIMRKLRTGLDDKNYISERNWGDGPFIKLSTSYRIRL